MTMGLLVAVTATVVALAAPTPQGGPIAVRAAEPAQDKADHAPRIIVNGVRFATGRAGPTGRPVVWFAVDGGVPMLGDLTDLLMRPPEPEPR